MASGSGLKKNTSGITSGLGLLAAQYGDSDEDDEQPGAAAAAAAASASTSLVINPAPLVMDARPDGHESGMWNAIKEDKAKRTAAVYQNPTYEEMWAPQHGPSLSTDEQRRTKDANIPSLAEALDPEDAGKTVEGYPAPWRYYVRCVRG